MLPSPLRSMWVIASILFLTGLVQTAASQEQDPVGGTPDDDSEEAYAEIVDESLDGSFAAPGDALSGTDITPPPEAPGAAIAQNDDLDFVRRRGVDLYERHQASMIALEAAAEVGLEGSAPEGWITERVGNGLRVRFVATCEDGPCGVADVVIDAERLEAQAHYPPVLLTEEQRLRWQAKQLVFTSQTATCEVPYNAVVVPPEGAAGEWTVYLVAQPAEADVVAVGGHARVFLDASARSVLRAEDFSTACLLARRDPAQGRMAVNYPISPLPAETHVLTSLLHQLVLFVGTSRGVFEVNGDLVRPLDGVSGTAAPEG